MDGHKAFRRTRPYLETVVHVLDAALGEAEVTEVDLVKNHSLQDKDGNFNIV
jgi:hypothetical protein